MTTIESGALPGARSWPDGGMTRVPAWIYTDPALYAAELERFFAGPNWSYVGLECEVPEPGSWRRSAIGDRPVLVVRDHDGEIVVLENRCAHRGSLVCWAQSGTSRDLTCPYHQWNYDLHGRLQGLPFLRGALGRGGMPADFTAGEHGLVRLRTTLVGGSIWASYGDPVEIAEYLGPELHPLVTRSFNGRPLRVVGYSRQLLGCNWKIYFDNSRDPYHATLLHSFFVTFGLLRADTPFKAVPTNGGRHGIMASTYSAQTASTENEATRQMRSLRADFTLQDMEVVRPVDEFGDSMMVNLSVFPSAFVQQHGNSLAVRQIVPRGVGETELNWTFFGYADDDEDMVRRRLKQANLLGPAGYVAIDDGEVAAQVQAGVSGVADGEQILEMGGRDGDPGDTMASEALLRAFYRFYRTELGIG